MSNNVAVTVRVHLSSLGCRLNEAELEQWAGDFLRLGDTVESQAENADVLVLNTCAVTREAVRKSRQRIQRLQRANPEAKVVVSGCYSTLEKPAQLAELGVDLVVPNTSKDKLVPLTRQTFAQPTMPEGATAPAEFALFQRNRHRAFIKIQDGCRYRCTFCIVTVARGSERSRSVVDICNEVRELHQQGIQEIVLTGVHVGGYGSDIKSDLQTLVEALLENTEIPRIRFASVEPWDLSPEFFTLFANPRIMPHMHLPLQSGSDTVLRRMARRCKTADFTVICQQLREAVPEFNVTTDIIVGFPGETADEWQESLAYLQSLPEFGHIHIFTYSEREGTKAATLPNPVASNIRQQRSRELHEIAAKQRKSAQALQLNQVVAVLWERGQPENGQIRHWGYTPNYMKVTTLSDVDLTNQILDTRLTAVSDEGLLGEVVK